MPNETRNLIVKLTPPDLAAILQGKAMEALPAPPPGKRVIVDWYGLPRFRSVQSTVSCEIDIKYHIEDVEPEPTEQPQRRKDR